MCSASSRRTRSRMSMATSTNRRSAPLPDRSTAMAVSMRSAWVTDAPLSIAILVAAVSCPLRVPTIKSRMSCLHGYPAAREGKTRNRVARAASAAIRLDDFRHGDAELLLDQHHFAARNQAVVHVDVDRFADPAVELQHRAGDKIEEIAHVHARPPEHGGDLHRHVEYRLEVRRAPHHGGLVRRDRHVVLRRGARVWIEIGKGNAALFIVG